MALSDLVPWGRNRAVAPQHFSGEADPFLVLHREINRMFEDFSRGFGISAPISFAGSGVWPHVEVSETGKDLKVVAELPGIDQKDVDLSLADGVLTIKGKKESESSGALYSERWHGQFQRTLQVGSDIDPDKVSAEFNNGVLTVTLAKRPEAQSQVRRISISNG